MRLPPRPRNVSPDYRPMVRLTPRSIASRGQPLRQPILHSMSTSFVLSARIHARERAQIGEAAIRLIAHFVIS